MFQVAIGSYETPLYGYEAGVRKGEASEEFRFVLSQVFAYVPHNGCIKALASLGRWLVSSSTDETVKLYDLKRRKELGVIQQSDGIVNHIEFISDTHMISCTDRGVIDIWDTKTWQVAKTIQAHKERVNYISVHPTGALALSVSKDKTLKLWNLQSGTCAHTTNLSFESEFVKWTPDGEKYVLIDNTRALLFNKKGEQLKVFTEPKRILAVAFVKNHLIATGGEERALHIWDLSTNSTKPLFKLGGFENRVKGIAVVNKPTLGADGAIEELASVTIPPKDADAKAYPYIAAISTDECLRIWDLETDAQQPIVKTKVGGRLTCVACAVPPVPTPKQSNTKKRKKSEATGAAEASDESEDDSLDEIPGDDEDSTDSDEEVQKPQKKKAKVKETSEGIQSTNSAKSSAKASVETQTTRFLKFGHKKRGK